MKEERLYDLLNTLTLKQTDDLLKNIDYDDDRRLNNRLVKLTDKKLQGKQTKVNRKLLRLAVPVACVGLCVILLSANPNVSEAIRELFRQKPNLSTYISTPKEEREIIPELEEVITQPKEISETTVLMGEELSDWAEIAAARTEYGHGAFVKEDFAWLKDSKLTVKEAIYEGGNKILITGALLLDNPLPFYKAYMEELSSEQKVIFNNAKLTYTENGEEKYINGVCNFVYEALQNPDLNEEYLLKNKEVPFVVELGLHNQIVDGNLNTDAKPNIIYLPENFDAQLTLTVNDSLVDDMSTIGKIADITTDIAIQAVNMENQQIAVATNKVELKGDAVVTLNYYRDLENSKYAIQNKNLSFDGTIIEITEIVPSIDRLKVYYTEYLPQSWGEEIYNYYASDFGSSLEFIMVVNGENTDNISETDQIRPQTGRSTLIRQNERKVEWCMDIFEVPSAIKTLELIPVVTHFTSANGINLPLDEKVTIDLTDTNSIGYESARKIFKDIKFTLIDKE